MIWTLGLTGGVGSGKSSAADAFAALGAAIVDTDAIAHALTASGGAAIDPIRQAFGASVITPAGALDRSAMRRLVFDDPVVRARLEALLHPMIRAAVNEQLCRLASADFPYAVLVVPLLVETNAYRDQVQRVAVVDCPRERQIGRVMARNGLRREEVEAILAVQATRAVRLARADDVLDNDGSPENLRERVTQLHHCYLKLAAVAA